MTDRTKDYLIGVGAAVLILVLVALIAPGTTQAHYLIEGGDGNNILVGDDHDNLIYGYAAWDQIEGSGNNDDIYGGEGHDTLFGGTSGDNIWGQQQGDEIFGGSGPDDISGGDGDDIIYALGDGWTDWVYCGRGYDTVHSDGIDQVASDCEDVVVR